MEYINFGNKKLISQHPGELIHAYDEGYVATRKGKGLMERVRSLRIDLDNFQESSENRRVLRKYEHDLIISEVPYPNYTWKIHKLGKDFYDTKFGTGIFSANKIKELFTSSETNFNAILSFQNLSAGEPDGYCISLKAEGDYKMLHYAYPFYHLDLIGSSFGIYMMTKTICILKEKGYKYIYLGSIHDKSASYKLQFQSAEWWDEDTGLWNNDIKKLKEKLVDINQKTSGQTHESIIKTS